ncbi:MAG: pantetheine-phosphate adenylyltransferase [Desulfovibrionaceae bacterium]|nr:pantetheine-phosphate adenylyltransferase [Desulfovibrionaceae bacterium]
MRVALYPGTFDPITNGHISIIERGLQVFDSLIVAVAHDTAKVPLFSLAERTQLVQDALQHMRHVAIESYIGLTVQYAKERGVCAILRGLRTVSDFDYELQLDLMNRHLANDVQTVFLMADPRWLYISSTSIKICASQGATVAGLVPLNVEQSLAKKFPQYPLSHK